MGFVRNQSKYIGAPHLYLSTYVQVFAALGLLIASCIAYYMILYYMSYSSLALDTIIFTQVLSYLMLGLANNLFVYILLLFYFFYSLIIWVVLLVEGRILTFKLHTFLSFIYLTSALLFIILLFRCEVKS